MAHPYQGDPMSPRFTEWTQALQLGEVRLDIAAIGRPGTRAPVVFLHGFGSTKEDYADLVHHPDFDDRPFLAWDAPAAGQPPWTGRIALIWICWC
ncbi:hypothetical protein [Aeromonas hydrophila]